MGITASGILRRSVFLFLVAQEALFPRPRTQTFQALWEKGADAFTESRYKEAVNLFDALEEQFAEEPEYQSPRLQKILLPARGYAQLAAGLPKEAAENFTSFLNQFPEDREKGPFLFFSLARAHRENGEIEKAIQDYEAMEKTYPQNPETAVATLKRAELLFQNDEPVESLSTLQTLYESGAAESLRVQARLRALQLSLETGEAGMAGEILLNTPWKVSTMPELSVLAFSALRVGDRFLNGRQYAEAVRAYRLVPPKTLLTVLQKARLAEIEKNFAERSSRLVLTGNSVWVEYYRKLIERIRKQLSHLEAAEDYTPGFLLRYGQAYLLGKRPEEALLVFQTLARDESINSSTREEAHYRWILSTQALEKWEDALRLARSFRRLYPASPLLPQVGYLIAQAFREERKFEKAEDVLTELIDNYPAFEMRSRWVFTRGFCYLLDEKYESARADFHFYLENWPKGSLVINAALWQAMTWFFEKNYPPALSELTALKKEAENHPLLPEIFYRRASVLYGMRDFEAALLDIEAFSARFQGHSRMPEARVLRGDILMGKGELVGAAVAFAAVTPEARNLFPYAVFQTGKIYRALEDYGRMVKHFSAYVDRSDLDPKPRISEALYWIGWAYSQEDRMEEAFPIYMETLETYGNRPEARDILLILTALQKQYAGFIKAEKSGFLESHPMLEAKNFESWLKREKAAAWERGNLTYFARLSLFLSDRLKRLHKDAESDALLFEVVEKVPLREMGAETLGRAGLLLETLGFPSASDYFQTLLQRFPKAPQRAMAYLGEAKLRFKEERFAEAASLLERFSAEFPLHPLASRATLLHGKALSALHQAAAAIPLYEELLRLKSARGRIHAEALEGLAEAYRSLEDPGKAIAYYQRIYTLYRAYSDLVGDAYLESARLFERMGNIKAASNSLEELLNSPELGQMEAYAIARKEKNRLQILLRKEPEKILSDPL